MKRDFERPSDSPHVRDGEDRTRSLMEAFSYRTRAMVAAFSAGVSLADIEAYLDWIDAEMERMISEKLADMTRTARHNRARRADPRRDEHARDES